MVLLKRRLGEERRKISKIYQSHWQRALRKYESPEGGKNFVVVDPETDQVLEVEAEPPPPDVKLLEEIQKGLTDPERLERNIDLDSRFQRRLGRVLRYWLPKDVGISLRTISRLITLVYLCADLAEEREVKVRTRLRRGVRSVPALVIRQSNRVLSLDGVDQKLRATGLS